MPMLKRASKATLVVGKVFAFTKAVLTAEKIPQFYWTLILSGKASLGYCPVCGSRTLILKVGDLIREHYLCVFCGSNSRNRALMRVLNTVSSRWRELTIHEASPAGAASYVLKSQCRGYLATHFYTDVPRGGYKDGMRCENLERMTFGDGSFDVVITQDVLEHVLNPGNAFSEIARILKPGGLHIFTVPYNNRGTTAVRAVEASEGIEHLQEPTYHGNPISAQGSLVTVDWGNDLVDFIYLKSRMTTTVYSLWDKSLVPGGARLDVFVSRKHSLEKHLLN